MEETHRGIASGARQVNIDNTDIRLAMKGAMRHLVAGKPSQFDPRAALTAATQAARGACRQRFEAFRCAGMVPRVEPVKPVAPVRRCCCGGCREP